MQRRRPTFNCGLISKTTLRTYSMTMKIYLSSLSLIVGALTVASAQFLPFQGALIGNDGNPLSDGPKLVQFQIFSSPEKAHGFGMVKYIACL